jgi:hypothetical protein
MSGHVAGSARMPACCIDAVSMFKLNQRPYCGSLALGLQQ